MQLSLYASLIFAAAVAALNPKVVSPGPMTYNAGSVVDIKWEGGDTGFVNIDLVAEDAKVLQFPLAIASGIDSAAGHYSWKVPESLKSSVGYHVRVWGSHQPSAESTEGQSPKFTVLNTIPNAVNTFTILTPNKERPCAAGTMCKITWDFPAMSMYPAQVNIDLVKVGQTEPLERIATVDSSLKSYDWLVPPSYASLGSDVYISVSGEGQPPAGPTMNNDMGGNSQAFVVQPTPPPEPKEEKKKDSEKKIEKPKVLPKVSGASKKEKNAAVSISSGVKVAAMVGVAALALVL